MQAYRITKGGGVEGLARVELPDPRPAADEVLIRVRATSLNYRDLMMARGSRDEIIPLSDGAGDVAAVGEGVTRFAVGDRVTSCFFPNWIDGGVTPEYTAEALGGGTRDGMLAQLVALPERAVVATPPHLTDEEAATLPCAALTAWHAIFEQAWLRPGQTVVFLGTGGVSIAGLQLAHMAGLRTIITSSSDEKLQRARELGADATINYRDQPDWDRAVLDLTGGRGADLVLEVGGEGTFAKSNACVRAGGSIVIIGGLAREGAGAANVPLVARNVHATRIYVGSRRMFEEMNRAITLRQLHPVVDRTFAFDDAVEAYQCLASQSHFGKVVIRV
jgi:NADPH:quinone reductase-like Zn-dependent oxidoreductase